MHASHPDESLSPWLATVEMPEFSPLNQDLIVDVCIVGGGIAGLTTAYMLMKEGKSVCVLESFEIGSGQTGRTTAHFSNALDDRYYNLEKYHGTEGAWLAAESHTEAIQKVAQIVREEKIDCDFEFLSGYLFAGNGQDAEYIKKEFEAAQRAGIVGLATSQTLPISGFPRTLNLRFPRQAQLHPLKYLKKISEIITERGGKIFTRTFAEDIKGGAAAYVKTRDGSRVNCTSIVMATNTPVNDIFAIHTKQYAYRTYAMAFQIPAGKIERALYWDMAQPYHYIRLDGPNVMIVGGEDHKTGQEHHPEKCFQNLESWTRKNFPIAGEVLYKWSGQVMQPMDSLAFLGRNPIDFANVYVITGDSGNGMTHATIGALLITDQIMNRKNKWEDLYSPSRISLRAVPKFLKENLNTAVQYADWITTKTAEDLQDMPNREGRVFRNGFQLVAVYRNEYGAYQTVSAVCPHLGGIVSWNSAEKSWDCPCHGSRFDCHGKVIEGPALNDLPHVKFENPAKVGEVIDTERVLAKTNESSLSAT